jgi:triosephosphate isomerase
MAGNWKMNLNHLEAIAVVQKLAFGLNDADYHACEVAVLPPFTDIRSVQTVINADNLDLRYGAQDLSPHDKGAFTGDVSGPMLAKLGCSFVTVGHSERREYHNETDEIVASKVVAALRNDITPILCVGEGLEIRQAKTHVEHTIAQVKAALAGLDKKAAASIVIAYEPVWAIGTGEVATPDDAQEVCAAIRGALADLYSAEVADTVRVLYGGSVKASNVASIMAQPDVDGALVGGASLDPDEFVAICRFRLHGE